MTALLSRFRHPAFGLAFLVLLTDHSFTGKEEEFPEIMELFAFVELSMNTPSQGIIFEVTQYENGLHKPPIFLEQLGQLSLPRIGLKSTDEQ